MSSKAFEECGSRYKCWKGDISAIDGFWDTKGARLHRCLCCCRWNRKGAPSESTSKGRACGLAPFARCLAVRVCKGVFFFPLQAQRSPNSKG